jgi:two-component system sensor kinase FixL
MTHRHRLASGDMKDHMLIMYPIKAQDNKIDYFVEIVRDETDYRNAIRQLQASEQRFRTILDTATNAVLSIDEDHNLILFNNAAERIFKYKREEILGKNLNTLIPSQYGDHYRYVRRFLEKRESDLVGKTINLTALRKTGEEFPIELSLSFMEMEGRLTFTAIIRDVSEEKQLERKLLQSERLAAVGQAVAHVVHELKNPLMIIGGFTGQIRKSLSNDKDRNKLDMILEEVARLERLVAGLGDFTKTYRLVKRHADVNSVISDVIKIISELYPQEQYGFRVFLSENVPEISCDPDKLKQVFINIISNGIEAMAEGGIITVSSRRTRDGIEVRITDEGVGIPESSLAHIFEPFYTTRKRGSGLGLSISYRIVEAHNGEITAVSAPGRGTTFVIRLPDR